MSWKMRDNRLSVLFAQPLCVRVAQRRRSTQHQSHAESMKGVDVLSTPTTILEPLGALDFESERAMLMASLREATSQTGNPIEVCVRPATVDSLRSLATLGSKAIHYSGHGHPDFLSFEDGRGGVHAVSVGLLKNLFQAGGTKNVQFVFVNSCHSRKAGEAFAAAGVPHVVCVNLNEKVRDTSALAFQRAFYLALIAGKTVAQSFSIGRVAVLSLPGLHDAEAEMEKFCLLPELTNEKNAGQNNHHDVQIFSTSSMDGLGGLNLDLNILNPRNSGTDSIGGVIDVTPPQPPNNLPALPTAFEGRVLETHSLLNDVLEYRLVTLTAPYGMGKSSLAIATGRYMCERRLFEAVLYVTYKDRDSFYDHVLRALELSGMMRSATNDKEISDGHDMQDQTRSPISISGLSQLSAASRSSSSSDSHKRHKIERDDYNLNSKRDNVMLRVLHAIKDRKILIIIDNTNSEETTTDVFALPSVVSVLLQRGSMLKVLVSSYAQLGRIHLCTERVHNLMPLHPLQSAQLLIARSPGILPKNYESAKIVAQHAVMDVLGGNAHAISLAASVLVDLKDTEDPLGTLNSLLTGVIDPQNCVDITRSGVEFVKEIVYCMETGQEYIDLHEAAGTWQALKIHHEDRGKAYRRYQLGNSMSRRQVGRRNKNKTKRKTSRSKLAIRRKMQEREMGWKRCEERTYSRFQMFKSPENDSAGPTDSEYISELEREEGQEEERKRVNKRSKIRREVEFDGEYTDNKTTDNFGLKNISGQSKTNGGNEVNMKETEITIGRKKIMQQLLPPILWDNIPSMERLSSYAYPCQVLYGLFRIVVACSVDIPYAFKEAAPFPSRYLYQKTLESPIMDMYLSTDLVLGKQSQEIRAIVGVAGVLSFPLAFALIRQSRKMSQCISSMMVGLLLVIVLLWKWTLARDSWPLVLCFNAVDFVFLPLLAFTLYKEE